MTEDYFWDVEVKGGPSDGTGPGSGHWGHRGRPGLQGGSLPSGTGGAATLRDTSAYFFRAVEAGQVPLPFPFEPPPPEQPVIRPNIPENVEIEEGWYTESESIDQMPIELQEEMRDELRYRDWAEFEEMTGFSAEDLVNITDLKGYDSTVDVTLTNSDFESGEGFRGDSSATYEVHVSWRDNGKMVGTATVSLSSEYGMDYADLSYLSFEPEYQNMDLAQGLYTKQLTKLYDMGYSHATIHANVTIGRYAWARQGVQYDYDAYSNSAVEENIDSQDRIKRWLNRYGIDFSIIDNVPEFESVEEIANWDPGPKLLGRDIFNEAVPLDMGMHLGKAYMLDGYSNGGHGNWDGKIWLNG